MPFFSDMNFCYSIEFLRTWMRSKYSSLNWKLFDSILARSRRSLTKLLMFVEEKWMFSKKLSMFWMSSWFRTLSMSSWEMESGIPQEGQRDCSRLGGSWSLLFLSENCWLCCLEWYSWRMMRMASWSRIVWTPISEVDFFCEMRDDPASY